jgi:hypothetical protein
MIMLPKPLFIRVADEDSPGSVEHFITVIQNNNRTLMKEWESTFPIEQVDSPNPNTPFWRDISEHRLIVPPDQGLKCEIMHTWHDGPLNGATPEEMKRSDA